jgi:hypothetical protein
LPNQDSVRVESSARGGIVVAVADGHGSKDSFRSDVGARLATDIAATFALDLLDDEAFTPSTGAFETAHRVLVPQILDSWRSSVRAHVAEHPVRDDELAQTSRGAAGAGADPLRAYGATLLLCVLADDVGLFVQLGDGDIVTLDRGGSVSTPVPDDPALIANETTSLCQADAEAHVRTAVVDLDDASTRQVILATDGYGNSFADATWRQDVSLDFARHVADRGFAWIAEQLPEWLGESAEAAGDDVTLVIVAATDGSVPPPRQAAVVAAASDAIPEPDDSPTAEHDVVVPAPGPRRRRRAFIVGAWIAALVVLLGGVAAVALGGGGGSEAPAAKPEPTPRTTAPTIPPTSTTAAMPATVTVPDVVRKTEAVARAAIEDVGLVAKVLGVADPGVPVGEVVRTDPEAGQEVNRNTEVTLFVSTGPALIGGGNVDPPPSQTMPTAPPPTETTSLPTATTSPPTTTTTSTTP